MFNEALELGQKIIDKNTKKDIESLEIFYAYSNLKQITINGVSISTQRAKEELGAGIRVITR